MLLVLPAVGRLAHEQADRRQRVELDQERRRPGRRRRDRRVDDRRRAGQLPGQLEREDGADAVALAHGRDGGDVARAGQRRRREAPRRVGPVALDHDAAAPDPRDDRAAVGQAGDLARHDLHTGHGLEQLRERGVDPPPAAVVDDDPAERPRRVVGIAQPVDRDRLRAGEGERGRTAPSRGRPAACRAPTTSRTAAARRSCRRRSRGRGSRGRTRRPSCCASKSTGAPGSASHSPVALRQRHIAPSSPTAKASSGVGHATARGRGVARSSLPSSRYSARQPLPGT